jgi:hypothetical protein
MSVLEELQTTRSIVVFASEKGGGEGRRYDPAKNSTDGDSPLMKGHQNLLVDGTQFCPM